MCNISVNNLEDQKSKKFEKSKEVQETEGPQILVTQPPLEYTVTLFLPVLYTNRSSSITDATASDYYRTPRSLFEGPLRPRKFLERSDHDAPIQLLASRRESTSSSLSSPSVSEALSRNPSFKAPRRPSLNLCLFRRRSVLDVTLLERRGSTSSTSGSQNASMLTLPGL